MFTGIVFKFPLAGRLNLMNFLGNYLQIKLSSSRKLPVGRLFTWCYLSTGGSQACATMNSPHMYSCWKHWEDNTLIVLLVDFLRISALVSLYITSLWIRETHWVKWVTEGSREERKERMSALASWPLSIRSLLSSNSSDYKRSWYLSAPHHPPPPPHPFLLLLVSFPPIHCSLVWAVCACVTMSTT